MTRRPGGAQHIPRPPAWSQGPPPPWSGRDASVLADLDEVHRRLDAALGTDQAHGSSRTDPVRVDELTQEWVRSARASAVLVPLLDVDGLVHLVLTRRADHLRNHRGEVSFPGGRMEHDEDAWSTALREAHEEIALPPSMVHRLGELPPLTTYVSNSLITPVVGRVGGSPDLRADPGEVARVFTVPLVDLVRTDTYSCETWQSPRGSIDIHFFHLDDETIWGATARMLHALITAILDAD